MGALCNWAEIGDATPPVAGVLLTLLLLLLLLADVTGGM